MAGPVARRHQQLYCTTAPRPVRNPEKPARLGAATKNRGAGTDPFAGTERLKNTPQLYRWKTTRAGRKNSGNVFRHNHPPHR